MSMLSSVAERLYWMARYLERAEGMAFLCNAYSHFILDTPRGLEPGWDSLIRVIDGEEAFGERYRAYTERNVLKFLIADLDNVGSIRFSIRAARENVRTTRDVLPEQCWELVNELNLYIADHADSSIARRNRFRFLNTVTARTQQINGMIVSSLRRDRGYSFIRMGRFIERSDIASRVVDVATAITLKRDDALSGEMDWLWSNLLKSLSAVSAYRRSTGPLIDASEVINFVLKDETFPGSVLFSLRGLERELRHLRNRDAVMATLEEAEKTVLGVEGEETSLDELHEMIDRLQAKLITLDGRIAETWFAR